MRPWANKWAAEHPVNFGWRPRRSVAMEMTPYWFGHTARNNRLLSDRFFKKWCALGRRVRKQRHGNLPNRLFWRLHPEEVTIFVNTPKT